VKSLVKFQLALISPSLKQSEK